MKSGENLVSFRHSAFEPANRTSALGSERYVQHRSEIVTINTVSVTQRPLGAERLSCSSFP